MGTARLFWKWSVAMANVVVVIGAGSIGQAIVRRVSSGKVVLVADIRRKRRGRGTNAGRRRFHRDNRDCRCVFAGVSTCACEEGRESRRCVGCDSCCWCFPVASVARYDPQGGPLWDRPCTGAVWQSNRARRVRHRRRIAVRAQASASDDRTERRAGDDADRGIAQFADGAAEIRVKDSLHAYQISKRGNSLRVMAEAVHWGKRGARVNTISPGIIITPLANDELKGPRGPGYRRMLEVSAAGRAGTPDEVGNVGALLMGPDGAFITGSDFLMDGGVTAAYWFGELAPKSS